MNWKLGHGSISLVGWLVDTPNYDDNVNGLKSLLACGGDVARIKEEKIENYFYRQAKKRGWRAIKFTSSSLRALPDRILICPKGFTCYAELKAPGRKPTPKQERMIAWMRSMGHTVVVIDSRPRVDAFFQWVESKLLTL